MKLANGNIFPFRRIRRKKQKISGDSPPPSLLGFPGKKTNKKYIINLIFFLKIKNTRRIKREIILWRKIDTHHLDDGHLNILDVRVPLVMQFHRKANDTIDRASASKKKKKKKKNCSGFLLEYRGHQNCKRGNSQNGEI